ncbi:MAG: hypothetical protein HOB79_12795 [Rhodospirillaceae bacterium]|nr:hypothetical protein [Rhodospirillales bacterium]MBT3907269.1 hypothetical protein [Rhodospirillaceae bacterium]MBT4701939.1 hypothetical protein [Rhodospirillaceae bacterium]MBT5034928.1 hypothetical protein [Rhodospirillaceae bacterium]MBT6220328.1 hypothetical protein [Rhodospirillaceae bacterium]
MGDTFDRSAEDLGNIVGLEHVNVTVPDQRLAILFYLTGMGFTRDPFLMTGVMNMWVNIGRSQIHMPVKKPQVIRGHTGLVIPNLTSLVDRLELVQGDLADTKFDFTKSNDRVDVICPWGNEFRVYAPDPQFGPVQLGVAYVEYKVPPGTADGIGRFYRDIFDAAVSMESQTVARISVGSYQEFVFRETDEDLPAYDGHHMQFYVGDFSGPHERLKERGLITQESNQYQYRCVDIVDPDTGEKLYELEHEVRSMTHPLYGRTFINRNPDQTNRAYGPGYDEVSWSQPYNA